MARKLTTGQTLNLSPTTVSIFGRAYVHQFQRAGVLDALNAGLEHRNTASLSVSAHREYYLELFRRHSPRIRPLGRVSRLSSFFAVASVEDAERYIERYQFEGSPPVYEVICDGDCQSLDMTWLDQNFPRDINEFSYYYENYWNGSRIEEDAHLASHEKRGSLIEILVSSPIEIGRRARIS